jgi:RNase P/RNase MRP subunit p29
MKRLLGLFVAVAFVASASLALAKDYQVTGPVVDVTNDQITVKKGTENWEIARDKDTKATGEIKKGDRVTIKYKMIATSVESKSTAKPADKTKTK